MKLQPLNNGGVKTILIEEDDAKTAQVLRISLRVAGYNVLSSANGVEGLKLAQVHRPDLILLDMWMPLGNGLSMAFRLRQLALDIPFIFLTGDQEDGLRKTAFSMGATGFFEKPCEFATLLGFIQGTLQTKEFSRNLRA